MAEATPDTICVKEKIEATELDDLEVLGKDDMKLKARRRRKEVAIADDEKGTKNLENDLDEDEVEVLKRSLEPLLVKITMMMKRSCPFSCPAGPNRHI